MDEVADSADAASAAKKSAPPTADQGRTVGGEGVLPAAEQGGIAGGDSAPPAADQEGRDGTTNFPPDADVESIRRMDEVVGDLPPIPLKLLVLAMLSGDGWKPSKAPEASDREKTQVQPPSGGHASTSTAVSTRE
jgi:hypothetical protein